MKHILTDLVVLGLINKVKLGKRKEEKVHKESSMGYSGVFKPSLRHAG